MRNTENDTYEKCQKALEQALEDLQNVQKELVQGVNAGHSYMSEQVCNCTKTMLEVIRTLAAF
jgi:hypothetical protein